MTPSALEQQLLAHKRACDAFDHLQTLTERWNSDYAGRHGTASNEDWLEDWKAYNQFRQDWDNAFAEFDDAVNDYAATLHPPESVGPADAIPRKPR